MRKASTWAGSPLMLCPNRCAATTVERMAYVREYLKAKANGDSHAQFAFNGTIR